MSAARVISSGGDDDDYLSKLPDDILLRILLLLPIQALIRLISVSKQFKSLIRNSQFLQAHDLSSSSIETRPNHLLSHKYGKLHIYSSANYTWNSITAPSQKPFFPKFELVGNSVRGVLCLRQIQSQHIYTKLILWNPSILKHIIVPETFTRTNWGVHYGFGFDHVNFDFKVVQVQLWFSKLEVMVYGLKTGSWRRCIDRYVPYDELKRHSSVFVNGIVYWLGESFNDYGEIFGCIMGFDLASEVFDVTELPLNYIDSDNLRLSTSVDGKSLVLFHNSHLSQNWGVSYLTDSVWEKRYNLVLGEEFRPLCIVNDDNGEVLVGLRNGAQWAVKGFKMGEAHLSATEVNHNITGRSPYVGYTRYTPSLALLLN